MTGRLLAFAGLSLLLAVTPGPDFALVTRNALAYGRRGVVSTVTGLAAGIALWVTASAVGLAVLLERSASLYTLVRLAGAAYLAFLGVRALWGRGSAHVTSGPRSRAGARAPGVWRQGLLIAALNPNHGVFFVSILPQFIDPGPAALPQSLLLGAIFIVIGAAWMVAYGLSLTRLRDLLMSARVRRWLERVTGAALLGFGAKLVIDTR
jgi:threonine/homoserine/homoserine lactone efflux protein